MLPQPCRQLPAVCTPRPFDACGGHQSRLRSRCGSGALLRRRWPGWLRYLRPGCLYHIIQQQSPDDGVCTLAAGKPAPRIDARKAVAAQPVSRQPSGGILGTIPIGYYEAPSRTGSYYLPVGEDRFPETIRSVALCELDLAQFARRPRPKNDIHGMAASS